MRQPLTQRQNPNLFPVLPVVGVAVQVIHGEGALLGGQSIKHLTGVRHLLFREPVTQGHVRHIGEGCRTGTE